MTIQESTADQLRHAIEQSGQSLYAVAKGAEVGYATVFTFVNGGDIKTSTAARIAGFLGLQPASGVGLDDRLRRAIGSSGLSGYAISKASGVSEAVLSRFGRGRDISLENADKIARSIAVQLI